MAPVDGYVPRLRFAPPLEAARRPRDRRAGRVAVVLHGKIGSFYARALEGASADPRMVALSYLLGHAATACGVFTVCLIPDQRDDALRRLREWPRHWGYAAAVTALIVAGFSLGAGGVLLQLTRTDFGANGTLVG